MPFVSGDIVVQEIDATMWRLREPVRYKDGEHEFEVPVGFLTDFASVPRALIWLIPRYGIYTRAAIVHDFLCSTAPVGRAEADCIFREALHELGVSVPRRWMMWTAVRFGGGMRGATFWDWIVFLFIAIPSLAFITLPVLVISAFGGAFWAFELAFWGLTKLAGRTQAPAPTSHARLG